MGGKLSSLPIPASAGGTYEGDEITQNNNNNTSLEEEDDLDDLRERGYGKSLAYASTFFLKNIPTGRYLYAGEENACLHGDIDSTSLMTFHGKKGEQINYKGQENLTMVKDKDIVTMYANIRQGGQYLAPVTTGGKQGKRLFWSGELVDVQKGLEQYEFIVHRIYAKRPGTPQRRLIGRTRSFRRLFPNFRRSSTDERLSTNSGSRTPPPRSSISTPPNPTINTSSSYNSLDTLQTENSSELETVTPTTTTTTSTNMNTNVEDESVIKMGDRISIECKSRPGHFLVYKPGHNFAQLSATDIGEFEISVPQLRHLVTLNGTANGSQLLVSQHMNIPRKQETKQVVSEAEAKWLALLQRLPQDIVYRILQYKGKWVRTARLVSQSWCKAAELHIHGIRVNGEFACITTMNERLDLLQFIKRCVHLTSLTLRNLDDLKDEDLEYISACIYIRKLALGGCRKLTDTSIASITKLDRLTQLNLAATSLTDAGLILIKTHLTHLESLNLYGCQKITSVGVREVLNMPKLNTINIRGTRIEKLDSELMQRNFPQISLLTGPLYIDGIYG